MKFSYSFDEERYGFLYDSIEEALKDAIAEIEALRKYNVDIPEKIFVGECQIYEPTLLDSGDDIIEMIKLQASDAGGEWGDYYLDDVTKEQVEELEKNLNDVFQKWIDKYKFQPNFYTVSTYKAYTYEEAIDYVKSNEGQDGIQNGEKIK